MLAVAGGKGGCGKTTTALGIASVFGEREPVTVVDADVDMPDLHVETETPLEPGLDALASGAPIDDCRHGALELPGVSVVPAGTTGDAIERSLERLGRCDERVVVDTPAGASVDATRPIRAADSALLVTTPTREGLVDATKTAEIARSVGTPIVGVLVNRSDGSVDPAHLFDCDVLGHVPTVDHGPVYRVERPLFARAVRAIRSRNV